MNEKSALIMAIRFKSIFMRFLMIDYQTKAWLKKNKKSFSEFTEAFNLTAFN